MKKPVHCMFSLISPALAKPGQKPPLVLPLKCGDAVWPNFFSAIGFPTPGAEKSDSPHHRVWPMIWPVDAGIYLVRVPV